MGSQKAQALKKKSKAPPLPRSERKKFAEEGSGANSNGVNGKYKIQIQMSERARNRLFDLVEKTEADSAAHVIRNGIRIYDILATEVLEKHGSVFLKDGETGETIRLELF